VNIGLAGKAGMPTVIAATSLLVAGSMLAACGGSGNGAVISRTGLVTGVLELNGGNPRNAPMPVSGRVCLSRRGTTRCTAVGSTGHFTLYLPPGTWAVRGSSPHYIINGKAASCLASDIKVLAGYAGTNVVVNCSVL